MTNITDVENEKSFARGPIESWAKGKHGQRVENSEKTFLSGILGFQTMQCSLTDAICLSPPPPTQSQKSTFLDNSEKKTIFD